VQSKSEIDKLLTEFFYEKKQESFKIERDGSRRERE